MRLLEERKFKNKSHCDRIAISSSGFGIRPGPPRLQRPKWLNKRLRLTHTADLSAGEVLENLPDTQRKCWGWGRGGKLHSGMGRSHNRGYKQILRSLESSEQVPPNKRILGSLAKVPPPFPRVPDSHKEEVLVLWLQDLYALPISSSAHSERARLTSPGYLHTLLCRKALGM